MNGSLLAILGGVALIALVLLWKWKASRHKPEATAAAVQEPESLPPAAAEAETLPDEEAPVSGIATPEPPQRGEDGEEDLAVEEQATVAATGEEIPEPETASPEVDVSGTAEQDMSEATIVADQPHPESPEVLEEVILAEELPPPESVAMDDAPVPELAEDALLLLEPETVEEDFAAPEPESLELIEPESEAAPLPEQESAAEAVEELIAEPEPAIEPASEAPAAEEEPLLDDLITFDRPAEPALLLVRMSMEHYGERLNNLEQQQRAALAEAIKQNDVQRRDQLQRELVLMNDRLALLADSYVEEMACYQQVLDALAHLQPEMNDADLEAAIDELQGGNTEAAASFLAKLSLQTHPFATEAAFLCGQLADRRVDLQRAMDCYRRAVAAVPDNPNYLRAAGLMARNLYQYKEALPWLERYVELVKQEQSDAKAVALAQRELAYTCVLAGQYPKAGPLYKESMTVLAQQLGQEHPEMAISWQQIGEFQETMGEYDKAVSLYKKALAILEKKRGTEHPALAHIIGKLAALCIELEMEPEAVPLYERLVRIQEKTLRPTHPQLVINLNNLAEAYRLQGRYAEAEACYQKTLRINEEIHGAEHPSVAAILQELAKLCTSQRKADEAKAYQERATAIFQKSVEAAEQKAGAGALTLELS